MLFRSVMNPKGAESLLKSKVKLGADAAVAGGPKGREAMAATDAFMHAEILTYSRSRGLFAGVSLEGSTLREDGGAKDLVFAPAGLTSTRVTASPIRHASY